jgi:Domain of unknown function (DUF2357)
LAPVARASIAVVAKQEILGELEFADETGRNTVVGDETASSGSHFQLLEDHGYEVAFHPAAAFLEAKPRFNNPFIASRIDRSGCTGRLPSSRFVGTVSLVVQDGSGEEIGTVSVEVRPRKLEYFTEFYAMLNDLSAVAARAGPWRPGFPVEGDHRFRWMTTTCSGRRRPGQQGCGRA